MFKRKTKIIILTAALAAPVLVGCQNKQHDEWVNQADDRWLSLRSSLMLDMAEQQFGTGDLDLAEKTVREAMQLDPTNAKLHVLYGRIGMERGRLEQAFHLFNAAMELDAKNAEAHYYQGLVLQRWQQYDRAHVRYQEAYDLKPDNPAYLVAMSEMLVELGRGDEATAILEDKLDYFDQNAGLRTAIAHLYQMQGRPDRAAVYFQQASLLDPDSTKLKEELALAQIACGQTRKAVDTLSSLLQREDMKDRDDLRRALAQAYIDLGLSDEARRVYLELARRESPDPADWLKLGQMAWKEGDLGGALHAANRVVTLAPQRHEGYLLAGMVWHKRDRLDDALRMFDRAAELAPQSAEPLILRGLALQRAGRRAAAAEAYEAALKRQPEDGRARRLLQSVAGAMP